MKNEKNESSDIEISVDDFSSEAFNNPLQLLKELEDLYEPKEESITDGKSDLVLVTPQNATELYKSFVMEVQNPRMNYSYKPVLLKAMMKLADSNGTASLHSITEYFVEYYRQRGNEGKIIEKPDSAFVRYLGDTKHARRTILTYPYKRLSMKGFMHYDKNVETITISNEIWKHVSQKTRQVVNSICDRNLEQYYKALIPQKTQVSSRINFSQSPFHTLYMTYVVGWFEKDQSANRHAVFQTDICAAFTITNNQLTIHNSSTFDRELKKVDEITLSPALCEMDTDGSYLGIPNWNDEVETEAEDAQFVKAPCYPFLPLTFECRVIKRRTWEIIAEIVNISAARSIIDLDGEIDLSKCFDNVTFIRIGDGTVE